MKQYIVYLVSVILLAACSQGVTISDPSLKSGAYRITAVNVVPYQNKSADEQADFATYKPLLENAVAQEFNGRGTGRDVTLVVGVNDLNLSITTAQAFISGGGPNVMSLLKIVDPVTQQQLGEKWVVASIHSSMGGLIGVIQDTKHNVSEDAIALANAHAKKIRETVYP